MQMKKKVVIYLLLFLPFLLVRNVAGDDVYTGKILVEDFSFCSEDPSGYRCGRGAVFVKGYAKRLMQGRLRGNSLGGLCISPDVAVAELTEVVVTYLEKNPQRLNELAFWLVQDALVEYFSCN